MGLGTSKFPPLVEMPDAQASLELNVTSICHLLATAPRAWALCDIFAAAVRQSTIPTSWTMDNTYSHKRATIMSPNHFLIHEKDQYNGMHKKKSWSSGKSSNHCFEMSPQQFWDFICSKRTSSSDMSLTFPFILEYVEIIHVIKVGKKCLWALNYYQVDKDYSSSKRVSIYIILKCAHKPKNWNHVHSIR